MEGLNKYHLIALGMLCFTVISIVLIVNIFDHLG